MQLGLLPAVPAATPSLLRPPGADGPQVIVTVDVYSNVFMTNCAISARPIQSGRIRKCSIVQEEDDDEEAEDEEDEANADTVESVADAIADCSLNRRGSRSEGRLNLTVADIAAEVAQHAIVTTTDSAACTPDILLIAPRPSRSGSQCSSRSSSSGFIATTVDHHRPIIEPGCGGSGETIPEQPSAEEGAEDTGSTVETAAATRPFSPSTEEAATATSAAVQDIAVAVRTLHLSFGNAFASSVAAASTAPPAPPRTSVLLTSSTLNEIYEEGTDCGSSAESASTTPRSLSRQSGTTATAATATTNTITATATVRRTKMHKTRAASCSSSDASDDDSENRKKRAHKIVGDATGKPFQLQRRDSYDDSSDSQEPGGCAAGNATAPAGTAIREEAAGGGAETGGGDGHGAAGGGGGSSTGDSNTTHRQKGAGSSGVPAVEHKGHFRRHRTGHRHRAGETRLRESQSLNRITEVQESESVLLLNGACTATTTTVNTASVAKHTNLNGAPTDGAAIVVAADKVGRSAGFSSRLFHGFRRHHAQTQATTANKYFDPAFAPGLCCTKAAGTGADQLVVDLSGALKQHSAATAAAAAAAAEPNNTGGNNNNTNGGASAMTKKLKILGRYFQVNSLLSNNLKF